MKIFHEKGPIDFFLVTITLFSGSTGICADNKASSIADWLFNQRYYDQARHEYFRLLYEEDPSESNPKHRAYQRIAECLLLSEELVLCVNWCAKLESEFGEDLSHEISFLHATSLMRLGRYGASDTLLLGRLSAESESAVRGRFHFLLGCSNAHQWNLQDAIFQWQNVPSGHALEDLSRSYIRQTIAASEIRFLNPTKGALLGIIPGLGYLYAGHRETAFAALLVIGLASWGTVASFQHNVQGIGYLSALLTVGWYSGSIYGSYWSCKRNNSYQMRQYLSNIRF